MKVNQRNVVSLKSLILRIPQGWNYLVLVLTGQYVHLVEPIQVNKIDL